MVDPLIRIGRNDVLTAELLQKYIKDYDTTAYSGLILLPSSYHVPREDVTAGRYAVLGEAYDNGYASYKLPPKPLWRPDNRVSGNYAKRITDDFEGFFLGKPIVITSEDKAVQEYVDDINGRIGADDLDAQLSTMVSIYGRAYRIPYFDENGDIGAANLAPTGAFGIYDEAITPKMRYFVRYYRGVDRMLHGSVSDDTSIRYFDIDNELVFTEERAHDFRGVPCVEFSANDSYRGLFEDVLPAINSYNKALGEKLNDIDAFAEAYLKIIGAELADGALNAIRDTRVINVAEPKEGVDIGFLDRPSGDATQEHALDRLERLIFSMSMVCDTNSDSFPNASGTAMRWRMFPMINLAARKWRKFHKGLTDFYRLVMDIPGEHLPDRAWESLTMTHVLNYPDEAETTTDEGTEATDRIGSEKKEQQAMKEEGNDNSDDNA